ncbi:predicted protein [Brucella ceti B1/94]|nr:hypothetical protein BPI_I1003 [Brucella pinnipedialis B2/94]EEX87376.1 predicted protein [Brucella ceti B1/94]EEX90346.1 predicted protein [Brucella ceti M13/05/1]EEX97999.1 predicted protein [Brucella ceti M644/93/1]EEY26139.1 conserved hypothetical protein [Brucella sp. F5/99]EEZ31096.1 predicted protein [Brucella pinnipedialis M292/94/1]
MGSLEFVFERSTIIASIRINGAASMPLRTAGSRILLREEERSCFMQPIVE